MNSIKKVMAVSFAVFVITSVAALFFMAQAVSSGLDSYNEFIGSEESRHNYYKSFEEISHVEFLFSGYTHIRVVDSPDDKVHIYSYDKGAFVTDIHTEVDSQGVLSITVDRENTIIDESSVVKIIANIIGSKPEIEVQIPSNIIIDDNNPYYIENWTKDGRESFASVYEIHNSILSNIMEERNYYAAHGAYDMNGYEHLYKQLSETRVELINALVREYNMATDILPYEKLAIDLTSAERALHAEEIIRSYYFSEEYTPLPESKNLDELIAESDAKIEILEADVNELSAEFYGFIESNTMIEANAEETTEATETTRNEAEVAA